MTIPACIQTYTGRKFWPLDPRPEDVCIEDIAHALSLKCRFGGHCKQFYSVAQHSVLVCNTLNANGGRRSPELLMQGLMHDAAEAYMPDIASPIKDSIFVRIGSTYADIRIIEYRISTAIWKVLGIPNTYITDIEIIKKADLAMLHRERLELMHGGFEWEGLVEPPSNEQILTIAPWESERWFLDTYESLK